jgi:hypothetical protein
MALVYRGMRPDAAGTGPLVANENGNALGVRAADIQTYLSGGVPWLNPVNSGGTAQGVSVATGSGCNLPSHRRPPGAPWNGTGTAALRMWQLDDATLVPDQLANRAAPNPAHPDHAVIAPGQAMPVSTYTGYIAGTAAHWAQAPAPAVACAAALVPGRSTVEPQLDRLVTAVAGGAEHAALIDALVVANRSGTPGEQLIADLDARAQQLDQDGDEDGAEAIRVVLDRLTGFCAPDQRVELD